MTEYLGVDVWDNDDLFMERDLGYGYGAMGLSLKSACESEIALIETYLNETSAKKLYEMACALELLASNLRDKFEEWERNGFEKLKEGEKK